MMPRLQSLTSDRVHHDHLDLTPLSIGVLLNTNLYRDSIKHANLHLAATSLGNCNRVILRVECMSFFLECNQSF
jgi:hypothetical protein